MDVVELAAWVFVVLVGMAGCGVAHKTYEYLLRKKEYHWAVIGLVVVVTVVAIPWLMAMEWIDEHK